MAQFTQKLQMSLCPPGLIRSLAVKNIHPHKFATSALQINQLCL